MVDKISGISAVSFTDPNLVTGIFWYERHFGPLGDICCPLTVLQNSKKIYHEIWTGLSIDRVNNKIPVDTTADPRSACQALLALSAIR